MSICQDTAITTAWHTSVPHCSYGPAGHASLVLAINPFAQREELGFKVVCIQRAAWFSLRSAITQVVVAGLELSGLTHPLSRWGSQHMSSS